MEHDHLAYVRNWGDAMLNAAAAVWRFADVPASSLLDQFFCRPAEDNKLWKAGATEAVREFLEWHSQVSKLWDDPEDRVLHQPDTRIVIGPLRRSPRSTGSGSSTVGSSPNSLYKRR